MQVIMQSNKLGAITETPKKLFGKDLIDWCIIHLGLMSTRQLVLLTSLDHVPLLVKMNIEVTNTSSTLDFSIFGLNIVTT